MSTYRTFADYNYDIARSRAAYAADMAVQSGICAVCKKRKHRR